MLSHWTGRTALSEFRTLHSGLHLYLRSALHIHEMSLQVTKGRLSTHMEDEERPDSVCSLVCPNSSQITMYRVCQYRHWQPQARLTAISHFRQCSVGM
jgi:hypothetical protein